MSIMIHKDDCAAGLALGLGIGNSCIKVEDHSVHSLKLKHQSNSNFGSELTLTLSHDGFRGSVTEKVVEDVKLVKRLSSPNSTVSSYTTNVKEKDAEEGDVERGSSRVSDEDDDGSPKKKLRLTKEQSALLEDRFKEHSTLNPKQKQALAKQLNLRPRQVEVWFQNRRARTKLKQTEVDCEFLKSCCERLTEENQRLHKEVLELKAFKYAPPLYMQFPAAALKICPSCEKINGANDSSRLLNDSARVVGSFVVAPKPRNFLNNPFPNSASC